MSRNCYKFAVDVVVEGGVDASVIAEAITDCITSDEVKVAVKAPKIVPLSEQGYKIWHSRAFGVSVEELEEVA